MAPITKFTPELLITVPRRGAVVPNSDGTLGIFPQSTHVIGGKTSKGYQVLTVETGEIEQCIVDDKTTDAVWLGHDNNTVLYLTQGEGGYTWMKTVDARNPSAEPKVIDFIEAPVSDLKVKALKDGSIAFVVVGLVDADGTLYNREEHETPHSARVTDSINPRVWDSYVQPQKHTLWYSTMIKEDSKWKLNKPLVNALAGTKLIAPPFMYEPENHTHHFDIGEKGIVFSATENDIADPTNIAPSSIYYLPFTSLSTTCTHTPNMILLQTGGGSQSSSSQGWCSYPKFSPDGSVIAFLRAPTRASLNPSIWVKYNESPSAVDVFATITMKKWELIPSDFKFAADGHSIYIEAQDSGRAALYGLDLRPNAVPSPIIRNGSVSSYHILCHDKDGTEKLLVTSSSLIEPWFCQVIQAKGFADFEPQILSNISQQINLGLSQGQISEIHFKGAGDYTVHAWVIKPNDFDPNKKYPLCILWNPAVWAQQGYIVVTPNITGSQGFGLDMAEAIRNSWGGRPYDDLVKCLEYVKDIRGIDMENAVAAGNSYGGYMMNWIQGHELSCHFKALVCHDGIFDLPLFLLESDTLASMSDEFGGPPFVWSNPDGLERYNPARPELLKNWKTPMLVIHSDRDYRVPVTSGIATFHALKALGTPARFLSFPDENHWVSKEENSLEWHRQVFAWINKWSGVTANGGNA
ncbi:hypothetical protein TruAng_006386 [Truncatella angustata]|nr:hypothetical protein TruAng_006386 [Truncatella angustata]